MVNSNSLGNRHGLTLFEIAISATILALAFTVVVSLLPRVIRAQEQARYQVYASAKVMDLMESFYCNPITSVDVDFEMVPKPSGGEVSTRLSGRPWKTIGAYNAMHFDLENRLGSVYGGLLPLPPVIARRLDSDNDEIQRLLDRGGVLYYGNPLPTKGIQIDMLAEIPAPTETRKLVYGFIGHAQQGTIPSLPWKAGPTYTSYPSPPIGEGGQWCDSEDPKDEPPIILTDPFSSPLRRVTASRLYPADPGILATIWGSSGNGTLWNQRGVSWDRNADAGFMAYAGGLTHGDGSYPQTAERAKRYVATAYWYAEYIAQSTPWAPATPWLTGSRLATDAEILQEAQSATVGKRLRSLRYLAHALMCMTRVFDRATLVAGVAIAPPLVAPLLPGPASPRGLYSFDPTFINVTEDVKTPTGLAPRFTEATILNIHQNLIRLAMRAVTERPHDWSIPKPINRAVMSDIPLFEWGAQGGAASLISGMASGDYPLMTARQWRPLHAGPMPIENIGRNRTNSSGTTSPMDASAWGNPVNVTLTSRFNPDERCRQIVAWAVDWQSYEDSETAPSAPVDASRYPFQTHLDGESNGALYSACVEGSDGQGKFRDNSQKQFRNPELRMLFTRDVNNQDPDPAFRQFLATGSRVSIVIGGASSASIVLQANTNPDQLPNDKTNLTPRKVFAGLYGADRNVNGVLDRGPVPASTRLRASLVARFNVYNPRLPLTMR